MGFPNLVLPFDDALIARLSERVLAVRVTDPSDVLTVNERVKSSGNRLSLIILDAQVALGEVTFNESWAGINLAVFADRMGPFRDLARQLRLIRELGPSFYLPADEPENLTSFRIMSSVNLRCGALFSGRGPIDWEKLADLMTYALVGTVPHGPIEPFSTIAGHYRRAEWIEWGPIFFDDPAHFLHVDPDGRIAFSRRELLQGEFIEEDIGRLDDAVVSPAYRDRVDHHKRLFLEFHPCSRCPGWRVCLGKFSQNGDDRKDCAAFTAEMIALLDEIETRHDEPGKEGHDHRHL